MLISCLLVKNHRKHTQNSLHLAFENPFFYFCRTLYKTPSLPRSNMKKIYIYSAALAAAFGLSACDSSSTAAAPSENQNTIKSVDDLTNCTEKKAGQLEVVQADVATDYICAGIKDKYQWIALSETKGYADDFKVCNDAREGLYALAKNELALFVCTDGSWEKAAKFENVGTKEAESNDDDVKSSSSKKSSFIDDDDEEEDDDIKSSSSKKETFIDDDDEEEDDDVKSSSSKNTETGEKAVKFVDGVIWQPSYGKRAWTGAEGVDEYNFFDNPENGGAGWWYKFLDNLDNGTSMAAGKFNEDDLTLNFKLEYNDWSREYGIDSKGYEYYYYEPNPYPYAGFGFDLADNGEATNITNLDAEGICVTYTSSMSARLLIASTNTASTGIHFYYTLPSTTSKKTVNITWGSFGLPSYAKDHYTILPNRSTSLTNATGIIIQYSNDESAVTTLCSTLSSCQDYAEMYGSSTVKLYKIGTYGNCDGSNSNIDDPYL